MRRTLAILLLSAIALACGTESSAKKKSNPLALSDDETASDRDSEARNEGDIELEGTPTRGEEPPPDDGESTTSSKPAPDSCALDADCNQAGRICDATTKTCIKGCRGTGQSTCPTNQICQAGACIANTAVPECIDDFDCFLGEICHKTQQKCVEGCYTEYDCPIGQVCSATTKKCVPQPVGTSSGTSGSSGSSGTSGSSGSSGTSGTSGSSSGGTVYCASDGTCNPGGNGAGKICSAQGICVPGCRSDAHCPGIKICDPATKMCK